MITREQRDDIMAREKRYQALPQWNGKSGGWRSIATEDVPEWAPTNAERSAVEVFDFCNNPPDGGYTAYIDGPCIITWIGDRLAIAEKLGRPYRSSFGDKRFSFRARGINGRDYYGTAYDSAGDYVRMRETAESKRRNAK